ncbi:hypothetical protein H4R18_001894 [Coemansia javaensis]|uniref:Transcription elongation factor Eaf N-terminal domain-containing protein n=1 Tax=Coemansia javaensis TaxID=2761396 RepID=A0A9W8LJJ6_9FUNG|nr:hypothetical protein H4R18_001894 [Coemansia javaensis]
MSINLDEPTEYLVRVGSSLQGEQPDAEDEAGFHLVSRQLPRTTTKVARETLEHGDNMRVRVPAVRAGGGKSALLLEADSRGQRGTCAYEGELERLAGSGADDDEITCVLVYDDEFKAFTIEKLASTATITSGALNAVAAAAAGGGLASALELPANTHRARAESRRESESVADEALEDVLAKELEDMMGNNSDGAGGCTTSHQDSAPQHDKQVDSEEPPSADLAKAIDDELFGGASSGGCTASHRDSAPQRDKRVNSEELFSGASSEDDAFEDVDSDAAAAATAAAAAAAAAPAAAAPAATVPTSAHDSDADEVVLGGLDLSASLAITRSIMDEDSDQFEDIGNMRLPSATNGDTASVGDDDDDDELFGRELTRSPVPDADQQQRTPAHSAGSLDDFDELGDDLARSLQSN